MAGSSSAITLVPPGQQEAQIDAEMAAFLTEVKTMHDTEKMSSSDQIARLFRPGAKYFNMNPFEVLGLPHTATADDVKRAYRRMSVQVHPDKNPGNELSQPAFEIVKDAHDRLEDPERFTFCARICAAAQEAVERKVAKEKKRLRKEGAASEVVPEDDPATMTLGIKIMISRMFAEFEQRKKMLEERDKQLQKRAKEEAAERDFMEALQKKEAKMWEKSRQKRVNGWRAWNGNGAGKTISKIPNKVKEERRGDGSGYNSYWDDKGQDYKKEWR